jgi:hypothetical protein
MSFHIDRSDKIDRFCQNILENVVSRSLISANVKPVSSIVIAPALNTISNAAPLIQMTQLKLDFRIDKVSQPVGPDWVNCSFSPLGQLFTLGNF